MNRRPLPLCRSLSDSGFEVTSNAGESGLAYYNVPLLMRQDADIMGNKTRPGAGEDASRQDSAMTWARESKACVMDQSLGVLDLVLESISRELEPPMDSNSDGLFSLCPPSYDTLTEVKTIISDGDVPCVDETAGKALFHERDGSIYSSSSLCGDVELRPRDYESLSDDDVRHLIQSVDGLHKKLDRLQTKMNGLLNQKSGREQSEEDGVVLQKQTISDHRVSAKRSFSSSTGHTFGQKLFHKDSIYVQMEQVYFNLQRMHFPAKSMNSFFKKFPPWPVVQPGTPPPETSEASCQTTSDPSGDIESLKKNCSRLLKENAALQAELTSLRQLKNISPPIPAPRSHRVRPHRVNQSLPPNMGEHEQRPMTQSSRLYTLVNCVAGSPTTPPRVPQARKDIRITEVTYEWQINNYSKQFQEQRHNLALKTKSAPFFIMHNGYCVRMEAYLDGDGDAKGSYLSVFLRMLSGEWDHQLTWPVHLKLTFLLINQTDTCEGSIKTIVEHSFSRPNKDCWGVLDLVSHEVIRSNHFICNDRLLLQCRVHILSV